MRPTPVKTRAIPSQAVRLGISPRKRMAMSNVSAGASIIKTISWWTCSRCNAAKKQVSPAAIPISPLQN